MYLDVKKLLLQMAGKPKGWQYQNINLSRLSSRGGICSEDLSLIGQLPFPWQSMYSSDIIFLSYPALPSLHHKELQRLMNRHTWQI